MQEFKAYLEDAARKTFIAPDTGLPGAVGFLTTPSGATVEVEVEGVTADERVWGWLDNLVAPGIVFELPRLAEEGDYVLTVTQPNGDDTPPRITTYLIHSLHDPERYTHPAQEV